jgi:hypothetical protein
VVQRWCRGGAEGVQRDAEVLVQRFRGAEVQVHRCRWCRGGAEEEELKHQVAGAQVLRCSGSEVQRCRVDAEQVQRWGWCRGAK